jgi:hypothetical protein
MDPMGNNSCLDLFCDTDPITVLLKSHFGGQITELNQLLQISLLESQIAEDVP